MTRRILLPSLLVALAFAAAAPVLLAESSPLRLQLPVRGAPSTTVAPAATGATAAVSRPRIRAEGRLAPYPGAQAGVGCELGGTVARVLVVEQARVKKGDVLAELASDEQAAAVAEARARLLEARAEVTFQEGEQGRYEQLCATRAAARSELDRTRRDLDVARARAALQEATLRRLEAVLAKTRILAPLDGVVTARSVEPGDTIVAGQRLFDVADLARLRVEAEVDEFDAARIAVGALVRVEAEGFGARFQGRVEEVPESVVARRLRPTDPGRPTDTRVLLVKVALESSRGLKLGQRVDVAIEAREPTE